jgi:hypothetical protein
MSSIVNNFRELMEKRLGDPECTPANWGRLLYKYNDCGPWVVFLTEKSPEQIYRENARIYLSTAGEVYLDNVSELSEKFVRFLGFNKAGTNVKGYSWDEYKKLIDDYIARDKKSSKSRSIKIIPNDDKNALLIRSSIDISRELEDHYYEGTQVDPDDIIGIRLGSIVEGSDVSCDTVELMFPFDTQSLEDALEGINQQAKFYWERDNSHWYIVKNEEGETFTFHETWGDIQWDRNPPENVQRAAQNFVNGDGMYNEDGRRIVDMETFTPLTVGWSIMEYVNDCTY